jgi:hypothetical protein
MEEKRQQRMDSSAVALKLGGRGKVEEEGAVRADGGVSLL